jgi:hypothetical protein
VLAVDLFTSDVPHPVRDVLFPVLPLAREVEVQLLLVFLVVMAEEHLLDVVLGLLRLADIENALLFEVG